MKKAALPLTLFLTFLIIAIAGCSDDYILPITATDSPDASEPTRAITVFVPATTTAPVAELTEPPSVTTALPTTEAVTVKTEAATIGTAAITTAAEPEITAATPEPATLPPLTQSTEPEATVPVVKRTESEAVTAAPPPTAAPTAPPPVTHEPIKNVPRYDLIPSAGEGVYHDDLAYEILALINNERAKYGLKALKWDERYVVSAKIRVVELQYKWAHERPDGTGCKTAFTEAGIEYKYIGENLAYAEPASWYSPEEVVKSWMESPGHRANILSEKYDFELLGVACYDVGGKRYYAQHFGTDWKTL